MSEINKGSNISLSNKSETLLSLQENAHHPFYQWEERRKPIEIEGSGRHVLSVTEKGESVVFYDPNFFEEDEAYGLMDRLFNTTNWKAKNVTIRGIEYPQPRLVAWYGPFPYSYSGTTLEAAKMPNYIFEIKMKVEQYLRRNGINVMLNSVLLNLYRHNKDSVSWHSDDESSMGCISTIASVSLGETRKFEMRRKLKPFEEESSYAEGDEYFVHLTNGSLLIMDGSMQKDWQHRVPKEIHEKNERINLTFRKVYKVESLLPYPDIQIKMPVQRTAKKFCRRKIIYDEKNGDCDTNSACSVVVSRNEDLSSPLKAVEETNRSGEERNFGFCYNKTSLKADDKASEKIRGGVESCSYDKISLKTEDKLNGGEEEQDVEISYNKESTPLNNLNHDMMNVKKNTENKILDYDSVCSSGSSVNIDTNAGKRASICMEESQSVPTNSTVSNINKSTCKIKNEPECSTDSLKAEEFLPVNTFSQNNTLGSSGLESLLSYNVDMMNGKCFVDYAIALKNRILESIHMFELSEKSELEMLCKLTDGTQTEDNQKLITLRMYSIIDEALKLQWDSPNSLKSIRNSRKPYHRNRSPYPQRWNQSNKGNSNSK